MDRSEANKQIKHHIKRSKYWAKKGNVKGTDYSLDSALLCGSEYGIRIHYDFEAIHNLACKNSVEIKAEQAIKLMKRGHYANAEDLKEDVRWKANYYHTDFDMDDFYERYNKADKRKRA